MNVWILQTGEPLDCDGDNIRPMRAMNLSRALINRGHSVTVWSSDFYHQEKRHRFGVQQRISICDSYQIILLSSPGYSKNISIDRLIDHLTLAKNLKKELNNTAVLPDIVFIGYPPIETAAVMSRWLSIRSIPTVVDVKDQWPIIFTQALPEPIKFIARFLLYPYDYYARRALKDASALTSITSSFLNWAIAYSGRKLNHFDRVLPLTVPNTFLDKPVLKAAEEWWDNLGIKDNGTFRIMFVGSHSKTFDMNIIAEALIMLSKHKITFQLIICGSGEETNNWKSCFRGVEEVFFPGWVDRAKIVALGKRSHLSLAPYKNLEDFKISVPNKIIDSLSLGLPIITGLKGEVSRLVEKYKVGRTYNDNDASSLKKILLELYNDVSQVDSMKKNSLDLYSAKFDCETVYSDFIKHLELLVQSSKDMGHAK
jgi:glycosyltransferase involved in cell wall biosynthesis